MATAHGIAPISFAVITIDVGRALIITLMATFDGVASMLVE